MIWTRATSRTEAVPSLALRILPDPARRSASGSGANRYGYITNRIRPIRLSRGRDGSELLCRVMYDYALCSDPDYIYKSLVGAWATLEYRPDSRNRGLQKVLFRGVVSSEAHQVSISENGVDVTFWDTLALADDVVELFIGSMNVGSVLSTIDGMEYLWPHDADGNRLGGIDPTLFERIERCGLVSLSGQPTPQAVFDLLSPRKGLIPDITYDSSGYMMLTANERGAQEIDIVVGRIKLQRGTQVYDLDARSLRGVLDYSKVATRITGKGDYARRADCASLTPAWDRSLDDAVLANPSLPDIHPLYRDVGKRFSVYGGAFPYNAEAGQSGTSMPIVWGRLSSDYDWMPLHVSGQFEADYSGADGPLNGRTTGAYTDGKSRYYRFDSPMITRYYTGAQQVSRKGGAFVFPRAAFVELQLQATYVDGLLEYDSGYRGDLPIRRRRILRNRDYSKLTTGAYYRELDSNLLGRQSATPPLYDATGALTNDVLDAVEVTCRPFPSFSVELINCDFSLRKGMKVRNMYDIDGTLLMENLGWFIETIGYTLNTGQTGSYTTELSFDADAESLLGGLVAR